MVLYRPVAAWVILPVALSVTDAVPMALVTLLISACAVSTWAVKPVAAWVISPVVLSLTDAVPIALVLLSTVAVSPVAALVTWPWPSLTLAVPIALVLLSTVAVRPSGGFSHLALVIFNGCRTDGRC